MFNVIQGRIGHSLDSFAVVETEHQSLKCGLIDARNNCLASDVDAHRKYPEDNATLYQERLHLREKISHIFRSQNKYNSICDDRAINTEEARQIIHGTWRAYHSEKFWEVLAREEESDFTFDDINPATIDHYVAGICNKPPKFMTKHLKNLLATALTNNSERLGLVSSKDMGYPSRRAYTRAHNLILFGGLIPTEKQLEACKRNLTVYHLLESVTEPKVLDETYVISFKDVPSPWKVLHTVGAPTPRAFHASTIVYLDFATPVLCIIGGFGYKRALLDMHLHMLCLIQKKPELSWVTIPAACLSPERRYGHTMGQVGPWLTIFGGTNGEVIFNDLWVLNIHTGALVENHTKPMNFWVKVDTLGLLPHPRCFHASIKIGLDAYNPIIIYGGITAEDTSRAYTLRMDHFNEFQWSLLPITIRGPNEFRAFHSMIYAEGQLIVTGGENYRVEAPTVQKCLVYSIPTREFQYAEESVSLSGHRSVVINGMMHHFGGLRSVCSRVYLEPIGSQRGIKESADIRNTLEHYFMREMLKDLEMEPKVISMSPRDIMQPHPDEFPQSHKSTARKSEETLNSSSSVNTVVDIWEEYTKNKIGRPKRMAAEKCVQNMEEELLRLKLRDQERANVCHEVQQPLRYRSYSDGFLTTVSKVTEHNAPHVPEALSVVQGTLLNGYIVSLLAQGYKTTSYGTPRWSLKMLSTTRDKLSHMSPRPLAVHPVALEKKRTMDLLYTEAMDYLISSGDSGSSKAEKETCARLYRLGVDPRLIFFHKELTQEQKNRAVATLESVSSCVVIPPLLIIFIPSKHKEEGHTTGKILKIPYDFDAQVLQTIIDKQ